MILFVGDNSGILFLVTTTITKVFREVIRLFASLPMYYPIIAGLPMTMTYEGALGMLVSEQAELDIEEL